MSVTVPLEMKDLIDKQSALFRQAAEDGDFKQRLLADPKAAFAEVGIDLAALFAQAQAKMPQDGGLADVGQGAAEPASQIDAEVLDLAIGKSVAGEAEDGDVLQDLAPGQEIACQPLWWGLSIVYSRDACDKLIGALAAGAGVATAAAVLTGFGATIAGVMGPPGVAAAVVLGSTAAVAGLIAAILATMAGVFQAVASKRGLRTTIPWVCLGIPSLWWGWVPQPL